jgi:hypothetical protein
MELVLARRLSYWAETNNLLPETQFGARPRRSCDQALVLLTEKIQEAWRNQKVLSLVSFDVKGAYNGVPRQVMVSRLKSKGIPERVTKWVDSFCANRKATVVVNGTETSPTEILESGLPQGSTLAPILYIFFNAALMAEKANGCRGNMGFVDDYTRWAISDSIDQNMAVLNDKVVPRALQWARDSGATFEGDKTILMHFSRNRKKTSQPSAPLRVGQHEVVATKQERILGVIFDTELRFKNHMSKVKSRGWKNAAQLQRLHHLGPKAARQLFCATVAARTDYAAAVWYSAHLGSKPTNVTGKTLFPIQKLGAQAVVKCFKTVSTEAASAEAALLAPHTRLQLKIARFWVEIHTLPDSNPVKAHLRKLRCTEGGAKATYKSPIQHMLTHLLGPGVHMEVILAWVSPPWKARPTGNGGLVMKMEDAIAKYNSDKDKHALVFADGSERNDKAGIGMIATLRRIPIKSHS